MASKGLGSRANSYRSHSSSGSSSSDSSSDSGTYSSSTASAGDESVESLVSPRERKLRSPEAFARTNTRGLELPQQKKLLADIETTGGGLKNVLADLKDFCNSQSEKDANSLILYGTEKSKQRKRVDNKIRYWGKFSGHAYLSILTKFGISPAPEALPKGLPKKSAPAYKTPNPQSEPKKPPPQSESKKPTRPKPTPPQSASASSTPKMSSSNSSSIYVKGGVVYGMWCFMITLRLCMEPGSHCLFSYS